MRYLIHSEDATFDSTTGKYFFNLDRRIANPMRIRVNKAAYTAATASSYPNVEYLRSSKIHELIRTKHTVELKDNGHEDASDALAVLEEKHTLGRYKLNKFRTLALWLTSTSWFYRLGSPWQFRVRRLGCRASVTYNSNTELTEFFFAAVQSHVLSTRCVFAGRFT